jgi:hypothetical protein
VAFFLTSMDAVVQEEAYRNTGYEQD